MKKNKSQQDKTEDKKVEEPTFDEKVQKTAKDFGDSMEEIGKKIEDKAEGFGANVETVGKDIEKQAKGYGNFVWPIILIVVGFVFLLNSFGVLTWNVWTVLIKFWPVLLILIGIQLILGKSLLAKIATVLLTIVVVGLVLAVSIYTVWDESKTNTINLPDWIVNNMNWDKVGKEETHTIRSQDYTGIEDRQFEIQVDSGSFEISDTNLGDNYATIQSQYFEGVGEPQISEIQDNDKLTIQLTTTGGFFAILGSESPMYKVDLGQNSLNTSISAELDSGEGTINLDELNLESLDTKVDSGEINIKLSKQSLPKEKSYIKVDSGKITIELPEDIGMQIKYRAGSGTLRVGGASLNGSGTYTSDNYKDAKQTVVFEIDVDSGLVEIIL